MPRQSSKEPLTKHTLLLFEGDFARLGDLHPEVGASVMVRTIVRKYLDKVDPPTKDLPKIEKDIV